MTSFGFSVSDVALICRCAYHVYRSSKQAGDDFKSLTADVKSLRLYLRILNAHCRDQTSLIHRSTRAQQHELNIIIVSCHADLEGLGRLLSRYNSLASKTPRTRDKVGFTPRKQNEIRSRITTASARINRLLDGMHISSLGRIETGIEGHSVSIMTKLEAIHQDVLRRRRSPSILTCSDDRKSLDQELLDDNISEVDVEDSKEEIDQRLDEIRRSVGMQTLMREFEISKNNMESWEAQHATRTDEANSRPGDKFKQQSLRTFIDGDNELDKLSHEQSKFTGHSRRDTMISDETKPFSRDEERVSNHQNPRCEDADENIELNTDGDRENRTAAYDQYRPMSRLDVNDTHFQGHFAYTDTATIQSDSDSSSDSGSDISTATAIQSNAATKASGSDSGIDDADSMAPNLSYSNYDSEGWDTDESEPPKEQKTINISSQVPLCCWPQDYWPGGILSGPEEDGGTRFVWLPGAFNIPPPSLPKAVVYRYASIREIFFGFKEKLVLTRTVWDKTSQRQHPDMRELDISVPKGALDGYWLSFKGLGNQIKGETQDLVVAILDGPDGFFRRSDDNLYCRFSLGIDEALLGWRRHFCTVDGFTIEVSCSGPTKPMCSQWLPYLGMPSMSDIDKRGHLNVQFEVLYPETLTLEQRMRLEGVLALSVTEIQVDIVACPSEIDINSYTKRFRQLYENMKTNPGAFLDNLRDG